MRVVARLNVSVLVPKVMRKRARDGYANEHIDSWHIQPDVVHRSCDLVELLLCPHGGCRPRHIVVRGFREPPEPLSMCYEPSASSHRPSPATLTALPPTSLPAKSSS